MYPREERKFGLSFQVRYEESGSMGGLENWQCHTQNSDYHLERPLVPEEGWWERLGEKMNRKRILDRRLSLWYVQLQITGLPTHLVPLLGVDIHHKRRQITTHQQPTDLAMRWSIPTCISFVTYILDPSLVALERSQHVN